MTTPAEYRQLALECMREAEGADHPLMRIEHDGAGAHLDAACARVR